jgi:hypothetical protein
MITHEFNFACDAAIVMRLKYPEHAHCKAMVGRGPYAVFADLHPAWLSVRATGWREIKWHGKTRHLCPICATVFLEGKS